MIGVLQINKEYVAAFMYVNCQGCGDPLVTEESRLNGYCKDCLTLTEEDLEFIDSFDPYGQPILSGVAA
ncbi:MAG: hypothetical protein J0M11_03865 [Anaerolineae bacterium]|nr:hypothetical protein [Anaerolineae bacterium]